MFTLSTARTVSFLYPDSFSVYLLLLELAYEHECHQGGTSDCGDGCCPGCWSCHKSLRGVILMTLSYLFFSISLSLSLSLCPYFFPMPFATSVYRFLYFRSFPLSSLYIFYSLSLYFFLAPPSFTPPPLSLSLSSLFLSSFFPLSHSLVFFFSLPSFSGCLSVPVLNLRTSLD